MKWPLKLWFTATANVPRRLPRNCVELAKFKKVLIEAYDVLDNEKSWLTCFGNCTSTEAKRSHRSWGELATITKRLLTNEFIHGERQKIIKALEDRLKDEFEKLAETEKSKDNLDVLPAQTEVKTDAIQTLEKS